MQTDDTSTIMSQSETGCVVKSHERLFAQASQALADCERAIPLSLLDATTARFALTNAIWLFEHPSVPILTDGKLAAHLRSSLQTTLSAYAQWCGHLKSIRSIDGDIPEAAQPFPLHARRYGRVYVHFGTCEDPGVDFTVATNTATLDSIYSVDPVQNQPLWSRQPDQLTQFVPSAEIANALEANEPDAANLRKPTMAVQVTQLACGGIVLAIKIAHPLADIAGLISFVRDWASTSRAMLLGGSVPLLSPIFDPKRVDSIALGNINADQAASEILETVNGLRLHRFDWWAKPATPPSVFDGQDVPQAGRSMPWHEWNMKAPVSTYTVHLSRDQVSYLWSKVVQTIPPNSARLSKHDAVLAHVWSCIARARQLHDHELVHCDLVLGLRPLLKLEDSFVGSTTMMINIEMAAAEVTSSNPAAVCAVAQRVRKTISTMRKCTNLAAHLHSIAYEKSPQRIWQAFLGQRHLMVTTWARADIYDIDFGFGSGIRYADGVVPNLDGLILMKEAPPRSRSLSRDWTEHGVDITLNLRSEDMERLLRDPELLPSV